MKHELATIQRNLEDILKCVDALYPTSIVRLYFDGGSPIKLNAFSCSISKGVLTGMNAVIGMSGQWTIDRLIGFDIELKAGRSLEEVLTAYREKRK